MIDTKTIAKELLTQNVLSDPSFTLSELFVIRDACMQLARFGLHDQDLLDEVNKYLGQKIND